MITPFLVYAKPQYQSQHLAHELGIEGLIKAAAFFIETVEPLSSTQRAALAGVFGNAVTEDVLVGEAITPWLADRQQVFICYQPAIVDNEQDSILRLAALCGVEATASRIGNLYIAPKEAASIKDGILSRFYNPNIEVAYDYFPDFSQLSLKGEYSPVRYYDLLALSDEALAALGKAEGRHLNLEHMQTIKKMQQQGVVITDVLLESLDARWSDHCAHTTWKALDGGLLKKLMKAAKDSQNPNILSMFHDNAGVWDFYDGYALALKAETHNGPSAISAYFGQLTKLGGVIRDILGCGQGANPIGSFEYTATGVPGRPSPIKGRPDAVTIARETIRGIKEYGNTMGLPMMLARMDFHELYAGKPFALGGALGLLPASRAAKGKPQQGDLLVLIGGLTGNDGIHGASASSAGGEMVSAAVQIGSPLEEIAFREAILELRDHDSIRAITDLGAAGLNSAVGEMGELTGVWLNTASVPLKTSALPLWRILLSESQERMLLCIAPNQWAQAKAILSKHCVRHRVVGKFTGLHRFTVVHEPAMTEEAVIAAKIEDLSHAGAVPAQGEVGMDVPYALIDEAPLPSIEVNFTPPAAQRDPWPEVNIQSIRQILPQLLADIRLCDQSLAIAQYDASVQGACWQGPLCGGAPWQGRAAVASPYWAGTPLLGKNHAALLSVAFNPELFVANPQLAARQMAFQAVFTLMLAGVKRKDICLADNFYTPNLDPNGVHWLVAMVNELANFSTISRIPFISGKDSSSGSVRADDGHIIHVPPAVFITAMGKHPEVTQLRGQRLQKPGNLLVRLGTSTPSPAGTIAAKILGLHNNQVDAPSIPAFLDNLEGLEKIPAGLIKSFYPLADGGMLGAGALLALANGYGVRLDAQNAALLPEHRAGALVEIEEKDIKALSTHIPLTVMGEVVPEAGLWIFKENILDNDAISAWKQAYPAMLCQLS
ncbi:MAG: AIR synthase-related protein [Alphaproteobacteria bacterium]